MALLALTFVMTSLFATEQNIITSDSVSLYIDVEGEGIPCLYIHGGPGSGSYWVQKFYGDHLEKNLKMIYLDQRGCGRSSTPKNNDYSLDRMLEDFETIRKELGITKWLVIGHSFAGVLMTPYAIKYPESISGLMYIDCTLSMEESAKSSWIPKAIDFAGEKAPEISKDENENTMIRMEAVRKVLQKDHLLWKLFYEVKEVNDKVNASYNEIEHWNNSLSANIMNFSEYWEDFRPYSQQIAIPVLFFYGNKDYAVGPNHYQGVHFQKMILWENNGGHDPFNESQDELDKAIAKFLEDIH